MVRIKFKKAWNDHNVTDYVVGDIVDASVISSARAIWLIENGYATKSTGPLTPEKMKEQGMKIKFKKIWSDHGMADYAPGDVVDDKEIGGHRAAWLIDNGIAERVVPPVAKPKKAKAERAVVEAPEKAVAEPKFSHRSVPGPIENILNVDAPDVKPQKPKKKGK